jgi:CheY-like chemotaxis protein
MNFGGLIMSATKATPLGEAPSTLLVVEDDVLTRCMVCDELRVRGYKVLEASSADDAIAVLKTIPVHLLFIDLHMPGLKNGLEVARFAQSCRPAPKIILTGKMEAAANPGLDELGPFIPKPYLISRVVDLVRQCLDPTGSADR